MLGCPFAINAEMGQHLSHEPAMQCVAFEAREEFAPPYPSFGKQMS
jgi:hypothetical protein